jgi:K+-sensing histidine kinase KdpD
VNTEHLSTARACGVAVLLAAAAAVGTKLLTLFLPFTPNLFFVGAVALAALYGGPKAALLCLLATLLAVNFFFIHPLYSLRLSGEDLARLTAFGLAVAVVSFFLRPGRDGLQGRGK